MRTRKLLLTIVAVAALAGCGDDDAPQDADPDRGSRDVPRVAEVLAEVDGLEAGAREQRLAEMAADAGGEVTFYTSMQPDIAAEFVEAFEERYDIDVSLYRSDSEGVTQRLTEEASAGVRSADVVEASGLNLASIDQELFAEYSSPHQAELMEGAVQGRWTTGSLDVFALSWNTDAISSDERPDWRDLADPRWEGRLALEADDIEWFAGLRKYLVESEGMTEDEADDLFRAMGRNARVLDGHTLMAELLSVGEFDVAASNFVHHLEARIAEGAPVGWKPTVAPLIGRPSGIAVLARSGNPAAALLLADWLLGEEGQQRFSDASLVPAREELQQSWDVPLITADFVELSRDYDQWVERYEQILSLGEAEEGE